MKGRRGARKEITTISQAVRRLGLVVDRPGERAVRVTPGPGGARVEVGLETRGPNPEAHSIVLLHTKIYDGGPPHFVGPKERWVEPARVLRGQHEWVDIGTCDARKLGEALSRVAGVALDSRIEEEQKRRRVQDGVGLCWSRKQGMMLAIGSAWSHAVSCSIPWDPPETFAEEPLPFQCCVKRSAVGTLRRLLNNATRVGALARVTAVYGPDGVVALCIKVEQPEREWSLVSLCTGMPYGDVDRLYPDSEEEELQGEGVLWAPHKQAQRMLRRLEAMAAETLYMDTRVWLSPSEDSDKLVTSPVRPEIEILSMAMDFVWHRRIRRWPIVRFPFLLSVLEACGERPVTLEFRERAVTFTASGGLRGIVMTLLPPETQGESPMDDKLKQAPAAIMENAGLTSDALAKVADDIAEVRQTIEKARRAALENAMCDQAEAAA